MTGGQGMRNSKDFSGSKEHIMYSLDVGSNPTLSSPEDTQHWLLVSNA